MKLMDRQQSLPYYAKFTPIFCFFLLLRFVPYYLHHFIRRPYRQNVPAIGYKGSQVSRKRRRRDALFDAMFNILLDGYTERTGLRMHPSTGQALFFLSNLLTAFDQCFERRLKADASLELSDIFTESLVQEKMELLKAYLRLFGREELILEYLSGTFANNYATYINSLKKANTSLQFDDILASVHLDSGVSLQCFIEVALLFNGLPLHQEDLSDFYLYGMVGKFADDLVDIRRDIEDSSPNLFYALLCQNGKELAEFEAAFQPQQRHTGKWWYLHCPQTYAHYFDYVERYYNNIQSLRLRLVCDLNMLPAVVGYDYDAARWETK